MAGFAGRRTRRRSNSALAPRRISPYGIRHARAADARLAFGDDMGLCACWLGHSSARMARYYARLPRRSGLSGPRPTAAEAARRLALGNAVKKAAAAARAADLALVLQRLREAGATSLRALAVGLDAEGLTAPRGGPWSPAQVRRVLEAAP